MHCVYFQEPSSRYRISLHNFEGFTDLIKAGKETNLCWKPGHAGIAGNEKADVAAKTYYIHKISSIRSLWKHKPACFGCLTHCSQRLRGLTKFRLGFRILEPRYLPRRSLGYLIRWLLKELYHSSGKRHVSLEYRKCRIRPSQVNSDLFQLPQFCRGLLRSVSFATTSTQHCSTRPPQLNFEDQYACGIPDRLLLR